MCTVYSGNGGIGIVSWACYINHRERCVDSFDGTVRELTSMNMEYGITTIEGSAMFNVELVGGVEEGVT